MDFANRLPRGRTYVRNRPVVDLAIRRGKVEAFVEGSELSTVTVRIAQMKRQRWRRVVTRSTGRIGSLVGLLRGELSGEVLAGLADVFGIEIEAEPPAKRGKAQSATGGTRRSKPPAGPRPPTTRRNRPGVDNLSGSCRRRLLLTPERA